MLRLVKSMVQRLLVKLLGTDGIARVAVQKRLNHARFRVLRHEVLLMLLKIAHHFRAERQLPAACPVDAHCLRPHLLQIGSGCGFVLQNVNLRLLRADLYRQKATIAGTVEGQEIHCVGCAAKHTLPQSICRVGFIRNFVDLLLAAQKRFDFFNALGIGGGNHLGHFDDPVTLQLAVYIFIVQLPQIVGKPLILACQ